MTVSQHGNFVVKANNQYNPPLKNYLYPDENGQKVEDDDVSKLCDIIEEQRRYIYMCHFDRDQLQVGIVPFRFDHRETPYFDHKR